MRCCYDRCTRCSGTRQYPSIDFYTLYYSRRIFLQIVATHNHSLFRRPVLGADDQLAHGFFDPQNARATGIDTNPPKRNNTQSHPIEYLSQSLPGPTASLFKDFIWYKYVHRTYYVCTKNMYVFLSASCLVCTPKKRR
jgi:hypothetical protein